MLAASFSISALLEIKVVRACLRFVMVVLSYCCALVLGTDTLETARFYTDVATNGQFGRLLKLGVLSFAIGDDQDAELFRPKLQHLVDYLNFTSVFFDEVFYRIWDSETEALEYALDAGVGLYESWAVVVFDELDPDNVDFTIRMNYTVVPDTGEVSRMRGKDMLLLVLACLACACFFLQLGVSKPCTLHVLRRFIRILVWERTRTTSSTTRQDF